MSRSELVKKGKRLKGATIVCGLSTIGAFFFVHWLLGVFLFVATGFLLFQTMKSYAASGMRF